MAAFSVEINQSNFQREVLEASRIQPVLVDFWAPWCGPCRVLTPVLEKLAAEFAGRFVLAKINSDENQQLAMQFGVRGIPSVKMVVNGELVDEFTGALPESAVRQFIERWVPSQSDDMRNEAMVLHRQGQSGRALAMLREALVAEPDNDRVRLDLVEVLIDMERLDEARAELEAAHPLTLAEDRALKLKARLEFAPQPENDADVAELEARVERNGDDLQARLELANAYVARGRHEPALAQLLEIVRRDRAFGDDAGRKTMLSVFNLLGNTGELVGKYRRLLASALH